MYFWPEGPSRPKCCMSNTSTGSSNASSNVTIGISSMFDCNGAKPQANYRGCNSGGDYVPCRLCTHGR